MCARQIRSNQLLIASARAVGRAENWHHARTLQPFLAAATSGTGLERFVPADSASVRTGFVRGPRAGPAGPVLDPTPGPHIIGQSHRRAARERAATPWEVRGKRGGGKAQRGEGQRVRGEWRAANQAEIVQAAEHMRPASRQSKATRMQTPFSAVV